MAGARVVAQGSFVGVFFVVLITLRLASIKLYCLADHNHLKMSSAKIEHVFVARLVNRFLNFRLDGEIEGEFFSVAPLSQRADLRVFRRFPRLCRLLLKFKGLDVALPGIAIAALFRRGIYPTPAG